jgi:hypothetical protein
MKALAFVFAVVALGACTPEIFDGAYHCGPNRSCPPGQECNERLFTCDNPDFAEAFQCPTDSDLREPNESRAGAADLGTAVCAEPVLALAPGCISDASDEDYYVFVHDTDCSTADPHFEITMSSPWAFATLDLTVEDAAGAVIATGESCGGQDGQRAVCITLPPDFGTYYVRVSRLDGGDDCDGDCRYNQYSISVTFPPA